MATAMKNRFYFQLLNTFSLPSSPSECAPNNTNLTKISKRKKKKINSNYFPFSADEKEQHRHDQGGWRSYFVSHLNFSKNAFRKTRWFAYVSATVTMLGRRCRVLEGEMLEVLQRMSKVYHLERDMMGTLHLQVPWKLLEEGTVILFSLLWEVKAMLGSMFLQLGIIYWRRILNWRFLK